MSKLTPVQRAAYRYIYANAQHQNAHVGWPGPTNPDDHCTACETHARGVINAIQPDLRNVIETVADGMLPQYWRDIANKIEPVYPEAARLVRSVAKDLEDGTAADDA